MSELVVLKQHKVSGQIHVKLQWNYAFALEYQIMNHIHLFVHFSYDYKSSLIL